uniref:MICOS complex subunit MIC60 n=1 Tax=Timema cristinae TaxID=61476 RepID=A0A7R9CD42_TIMCR|nr:unnamed protein product [Timema cristinae]
MNGIFARELYQNIAKVRFYPIAIVVTNDWLLLRHLKMLRIIATKNPYCALSQTSRYGSSRLGLYYFEKQQSRYSTSRLFLYVPKQQAKYYTSGSSCPPSGKSGKKSTGGGGGTGFVYTIGTLTLIFGGGIAYAKYDPDFREWLGENVPYSDEFFKSIFQEEQSYQLQLENLLKSIKRRFLELIFGVDEATQEVEVSKDVCDPIDEDKKTDFISPRSAFASLADKESEVPETNWTEIRVSDTKQPDEIEIVQSDKPVVENVADANSLPETHPKKLAILEEKIVGAAANAVEAFDRATCFLEDYNNDIFKIVETSVEKLDSDTWATLKLKTENRDKFLKDAEEKANEAMIHLNKMKALLKDDSLDAPEAALRAARHNVDRIMANVEKAANKLETERKKSRIVDKYWKMVEESRKHFREELEILFPSVRIQDRSLRIPDSQVDLFVLHTYQRILFYQKELHKLQTLGEDRIRVALEEAGKGIDRALVNAQVEMELEKELRHVNIEFQKKILKLQVENDQELRKQLKLQQEIHSDHMADVIKVKEHEAERQFLRRLDEKLAEEQAKFKTRLASMLGRLKGIDAALKARASADKGAHKSQVLWSACQALAMSLKVVKGNVPWHEQLRPLTCEISAINSAASPDDEFVSAVLNGIPREAVQRGVYPETALRERFLKIEREARRLALVPDTGASLPVYFLSYLQSFFLIPNVRTISQAELGDEPVSFEELDTYDILLRARYWVDRGDFARALGYMNLLHGAARSIARDWMAETRILLETQQAATALITHAAAIGLLYL